MTLEFKTQYLEAIRNRYFNSSKKGKTQILNELCKVTGYSRKHAIKVLTTGHITGRKNSGRTKMYSAEAKIQLQKLWQIMGQICSKKMVAAIPIWLNYYQDKDICELVRAELLSMSSATIDRYLKTYKKQLLRRKRSGTRRSRKFNNIIPIKSFDQLASKPGYIQADTVAHCGNSVTGLHVWSMTITDEYSGWTECRAMWGKGGGSPLDAIHYAFSSLPFKAISFNSDNGSEFLNDGIHSYICNQQGIQFTRSRPYKKNDNAFVEQKNFTHVREIFGYDRFEFKELVDPMNEIYGKYFCVLHNFFIPQQKLISKVRFGSKYIKKYDKAKTPFERVMESPDISKHDKNLLQERFEKLNPVILKAEIDRLYKEFLKFNKKLIQDREDLRAYYQERSAKFIPKPKVA